MDYAHWAMEQITKQRTEAADSGGFGMENLITPLGYLRRY